jgi:hypothetical protein
MEVQQSFVSSSSKWVCSAIWLGNTSNEQPHLTQIQPNNWSRLPKFCTVCLTLSWYKSTCSFVPLTCTFGPCQDQKTNSQNQTSIPAPISAQESNSANVSTTTPQNSTVTSSSNKAAAQSHKPPTTEAKEKRRPQNSGRGGRGSLILSKGRGNGGSGWTGAGFDVDPGSWFMDITVQALKRKTRHFQQFVLPLLFYSLVSDFRSLSVTWNINLFVYRII